MFSYYRVLGLNRDATEREIKQAYHRQSLKVHPDKPEGSKEKFQELDLAHRVLSDCKKKARYDKLGLDLQEREGDGVDEQVIALGFKIKLGIFEALVRTAGAGVFVVLLPRFWLLQWSHALTGLGIFTYGSVVPREELEVRQRGGDNLSLGEVLKLSSRNIGIRLMAIFAAGYVSHRTLAGKRWNCPWFYNAGIVLVASGGLEPSRFRSPSKTLLGVQILGCLGVAKCMERPAWRWFSIFALESTALIAAAFIFPFIGSVAATVADRKLEQYARLAQELAEHEAQRIKRLERRLSDLDGIAATSKAKDEKLQRYLEVAQKAREVAERNVEQKKQMKRQIAELEAALVTK